MNYQQQFESLFKKYVKRQGADKLLESLAKSDFYTAPASTRYHHSYEGGLVKHTLEVFHFLMDELGDNDSFKNESIAIVSLLHDVCKVGYYGTEMRNRKNEQGNWEKYPFYIVEDKFPMGHGEKSIILILEHMKLTVEEMMAIRWHMNGFEPKENYNTMSKAYSEYPLALHLAIADLKSTYLSERGKV